MALSLIKNLVKVTVGVGAVYLTVEQGVWGDPTQGEVTVKRLSSTIPAEKDYFVKIPTTQQVADTMRDNWNYGVQKTFGVISETPQNMRYVYDKYMKKS